MSSDAGLRRTRHNGRFVWALALASLLLLNACGRKEDPKPPPAKNPAKTRDLKVRQRGMELILVMGYPTATAGGQALPGIDRIRYFQYTRLAPEFMEQEDEGLAEEAEAAEETTSELDVESLEERDLEAVETTAEEGESEGDAEEEPEEDAEIEEPNRYLQILVDPDQFRKNSEEVLVLEGESLDSAVIGGQVVVRLPLNAIETEPPMAYSFATRTYAGRLESPESNTASFVPLPPPPSPSAITAVPEARGVRLSWEALADDEEIVGYRVYRKAPTAKLWGNALATLQTGQTEYFDRGARFGASYLYAVTALKMREPAVESAFGDEVEVTFTDDFAPAAPRGVVVLSEVGSTRVVWEVSTAADVAGYLVYVSVGDGELEPLTPEPVSGNEYVHTGTESGVTYSYVVVAIDQSGNRSEASEPVSTRAP